MLLALLVVCACLLGFVTHLSCAKDIYHAQLTRQIEQYLAQQSIMLQRLGKNLIGPLKQSNIEDISQKLFAYEEILFLLAKQNLAIPVSAHLVAMDAPRKIIGSFGLLDVADLAPDEQYYTKIVEDPNNLAISQLYIKQEMPDYYFLNIGLGVVDSAGNYLGQVDLKLAVLALQAFLKSNLHEHAHLFNFKLADNNLLNPQVSLNKTNFWLEFLQYMSLRIGLASILAWFSFVTHKLYRENRQHQQESNQLQKQLLAANTKLSSAVSAAQVQNYYSLLATNGDNSQLIIVQQLLDDVKAVNLVWAIELGVQLSLPMPNQTNLLRFHGNKFRLMQILSGILHAIISMLSSGGNVELGIITRENQHGQHKLIFTFQDNGFYDALPSKPWDEICALVGLESGELEHVHTAYVGNMISLTIARKLVTNVINLESYHQGA